MKLLVLGAGGFIGSHIVEHLVRLERVHATVFDRDMGKLEEAVPDLVSKVVVVKGDLGSDIGVVRELVRESDVVVDLIAYANPSVYVERPLDVVKLNFTDNMEVVKACVEYGKHLIQFSSCEVYGITGGRADAFSEDSSSLIMGPVTEHRWIYASAKQLLERMVHAYGLNDQLSYTIIRPFNFIGPRIDYLPEAGSFGGPRVFSHFMSALLNDGPMHLVNGGMAQRSYTYIEDAVDAFMIVLQGVDGSCHNQIINIGNPKNETTIRDFALQMMSIWKELTKTDSSCPIVNISGDRFYGKGYADCDRRIPDVRKLSALGWIPKYGLAETLRRSMKYYIDKWTALRREA